MTKMQYRIKIICNEYELLNSKSLFKFDIVDLLRVCVLIRDILFWGVLIRDILFWGDCAAFTQNGILH